MKSEKISPSNNNLVAKLFAVFFILICLAVGVVGIILPIIPGLLFFAMAAMIAANFFPAIDVWLRKSKTMSRYLDSSDGFFQLTIWGKVQYCGWLCVKIFIDSIVLIIALVTKLFSFASNKYQYHR